MYRVDNAVIMAAGTSSRFAPLSYEVPKGLLNVKGEILIERQIKQLIEAGIPEIIIVVGYRKKQFEYLKEKYGVILVENPDYLTRNNNASIFAVRNYLKNTYICSADNYFTENPFNSYEKNTYYSAIFAEGKTAEWCIATDENDRIRDVVVGGENSWCMLGHVFWAEDFSKKFLDILLKEYNKPETFGLLWESIYINHINELDMKIKRYKKDMIFEFDTLEELRLFDKSYISDTRSQIIKNIAKEHNCQESDIINVVSVKGQYADAIGFEYTVKGNTFGYTYEVPYHMLDRRK